MVHTQTNDVRNHRKFLLKGPELNLKNSRQKALCNRCPVKLGNSFLFCKCVLILGLLVDGQNRESPIASVQETRSTLAGRSTVRHGTNVARMIATRAIRIAAQQMQGL